MSNTEYETLEIVRAGAVATVWMNRPAVHNAFNETLIADLTAVCAELASDDQVRVVVLAGRGKSFSAGADLSWMQRAGQASEADNLADARRLAEMLRALAELGKPTIARVHGAALGGGLGLAAACDMCVATPQAVFATSEVLFGIIPSAISPYVIRAIGERQAARYFLSAERISAERAGQLGLAHEVVPAEALDQRLEELTTALLRGGPQAQAAAKQLIAVSGVRAVSDALIEETARRIARLRSGAEAREGLGAFLEKRPPSWLAG